MSVNFTDPEATDESSMDRPLASFAEVLGNEEFTWTSKDGTKTVAFGRPKGLVSLTIAAVLGPQQSSNQVLENYYRAAAGVRSFNGQAIPQPQNKLQFDGILAMFGDDDTMNAYVIAYHASLNPEIQAALMEAAALGATPETVERILKNAGVEHAKKSPRPRSSTRSSA